MKKIAIVYFSGAGSTRYTAFLMHHFLHKNFKVSIFNAESMNEKQLFSQFDAFVFGFPIFHAQPAQPIVDFLEKANDSTKPKPVFAFCTCGLYAANALRKFAVLCQNKGLVPVLCREYRGCPASDGVLIAPFIKRFYQFPAHFKFTIQKDISHFSLLVNVRNLTANMPRFKLYGIMNFPNEWAGRRFSPTIYLHKKRCNRCGKCIRECPTAALTLSGEKFPVYIKQTCIHCYRCIHHCPLNALSLSQKRVPNQLSFTNQI